MAGGVKRAFRYRFCPSDVQAVELSRTFGCVRKVYNLGLAARSEAWTARRERVGYHQTSAMLTGWKKTADLAFLAEVSCVPLQQALRHLQTAFSNFFAQRAGYPRFKAKHKSRASAEYTRSGFTFRDGRLDAGQDGPALGHRLVAAAACGQCADDGDRFAGCGRAVVRVAVVRRPDRASLAGRRCGGGCRRRPGASGDLVDRGEDRQPAARTR